MKIIRNIMVLLSISLNIAMIVYYIAMFIWYSVQQYLVERDIKMILDSMETSIHSMVHEDGTVDKNYGKTLLKHIMEDDVDKS